MNEDGDAMEERRKRVNAQERAKRERAIRLLLEGRELLWPWANQIYNYLLQVTLTKFQTSSLQR